MVYVTEYGFPVMGVGIEMGKINEKEGK